MTLETAKRDYKMSDATLKQRSDQTKLYCERDIISFNTRNVTQLTLDDFKDLIDIFDDTPTDVVLKSQVMEKTEIKDALAEQIRIAIRPIRNMAELKYGNSAKYQGFGFKNMDKLNDDELRRMAKTVVLQGTTLLAELASEGLTQTMLTNLTNLTDSFDDAIDAQKLMIAERDSATEDRINKGNTLYAELSRLCSIGRSLFIDTDPAKYNDYVIYGSTGTNPSLKGVVQDSVSHEPLSDATIDITSVGIIIISNAEGKFEVHALEEGGYDINVSRPEYQPQTIPVTITAGQTTEIEVNLVHD